VVAARASGVPDIFRDGEASGGLVVAVDDEEGLAAALGRLLDDAPLAAELGRRARRRVEDAFSLDAVGRQLRAALQAAGVALDAPVR
jgi:starch synthase